ncbi:hypothetical protein Nepgr_005119 [Nepenthes gracilis]|uniref:Enoyl reductase (ER) domain-containing protein n=1 Tax=Nepenthes gracilis TaxID=150966 RepID=A0AAD3S2K1_NEPGR|nr:hypothetical protein Nepgr_005119 [Nepenthes gracilis]
MELKPGLSALVTGGASGIGKALCVALGERGLFVTVVDISDKGSEVAALVVKENAKFHTKLTFPSAMFIRCDVTNTRELSSAFHKHFMMYGGLDVCINSAGIVTHEPFHEDQTDGLGSWRCTIDVNLIAVIDCTRLAIQTMQASQKPGVIINMASAAGLYPLYGDPVYAASKGGVVLFTRSLRPYKRQGIRVNVLCPEFIDTGIISKVDPKFIDSMGGFVPMEMVIKGAFELISNENKAGSCLWITNRRGLEYWPTPTEQEKYLLSSSKLKRRFSVIAPQEVQIPQSFEKIVVHTLSHNFRKATMTVRAPLRLPITPNHVFVKIVYAGVNASDVNFSSGHYFDGNKNLTGRLPFDAGFEAVGIIAALGESVHDLKIGMSAAVMMFGCYAEFMTVPSKYVLPVPRPDPEVVAMLSSGLTASIALEKAAQRDSGKVVLVTAAAGGTGQFAVQLAKLAGNTVVATCGGQEKAKLLKNLGVDRVIDYLNEDIKTILKKEFPNGIDIIYESVGGKMFDLCINALAIFGQMIVIGMISQYQHEHGWEPHNYPGLCEKLLKKSQTLTGFFLVQYSGLWRQHLDKLFHLFSSGKLKVTIDPKSFVGLHSVADAVEYLHSGKSMGKVMVCVDPTFSQLAAKSKL